AFRDIAPAAPVHVLVVPRRHFATAAELSTQAPTLMAQVIAATAEIAEAEGIAESGYRLVVNTGPDAGQSGFHVHVHVLGGTNLVDWSVGLPTREQLGSA